MNQPQNSYQQWPGQQGQQQPNSQEWPGQYAQNPQQWQGQQAQQHTPQGWGGQPTPQNYAGYQQGYQQQASPTGWQPQQQGGGGYYTQQQNPQPTRQDAYTHAGYTQGGYAQGGYSQSGYGQQAGYGGYLQQEGYGLSRAGYSGAATDEKVGKGTAFSAAVIPAAFIVCLLIAMIGFVSFWVAVLIPVGAAFLYQLGAGSNPQRGKANFVGVSILAGISGFFGVIAGLISKGYSEIIEEFPAVAEIKSRGTFITENMFTSDAIQAMFKEETFNTILFLVCIAVGIALVLLKRLPWMQDN